MSARTARLEALTEPTDEYQQLLDQLKQVELDYKLGQVDKRIENEDGSLSERWAFEETLDQLEPLLQKCRARLLEEEPAWYYKYIAIHAEAKEYFDNASAAYRLDTYTLAEDLYRGLPERVEPDQDKERIVLKNKIRVIVRGLEYLYRIGDYAGTIDHAEGLYDFVINSGLKTAEKPADATLAIIYNLLGRAHRERGIDDDYQKAIDYFYKCSESYYEMARRREGNQEADVVYARTRAMVSLAFGAGFLFYNAQSDLVRAKALIAQARLAFLRDNSTIACELHYNSLELLYATILRAEAGEIVEQEDADSELAEEQAVAREKLNRAKSILDKCGETLGSKPKYYIHILFHKALVNLYLGREHYAEGLECLNELLTKSFDNPRWSASGLIVKSHFERRLGRFDVAFADALKAYNLAGNHIPLRIEALLAQGQAKFARGQLVGARSDVEKAMNLNSNSNLKLTAMGYLLLVDIAIAEHKPGQAYEKFREVEKLMPSICHGYIRKKFRQLSVVIDSLQKDFVISGASKDLDYKKLDSELQAWLLQKALREDRNLTRVADRLKVTKKTIYLWLAKHNIKD